MYLVMLAHSLLLAQVGQGRASDWAHTVLRTIDEAFRAVSREMHPNALSGADDQATIGGLSGELPPIPNFSREWNLQKFSGTKPVTMLHLRGW